MQITLTAGTIITFASLLGAIGVILGAVIRVNKFVEKQETHSYQIKDLKHEQQLMFTALCACLDGLQQLGCNHSVPKAKEQLEQWLNEQAHE